ncbi:MAG: adenylate/guanylate cyclase domain-containing protein [Thermoplasmata archaeon]
MEPPEVNYSKSGEVHIAYQVLGSGPVDFLLARSGVYHLEIAWDHPLNARYHQELASLGRLIAFDKRGTGLSDRDVGVATLEERMDDGRAVLDAVGSKRAILVAARDAASVAVLFAATYPERTRGLILMSPLATGVWSPECPWAPTREQWESAIRRDLSDWGSTAHIDRVTSELAPSRIDDAEFKRWLGRLYRNGASPAAGMALARMNMEIDVRPALEAVHVPTLVLHARGDRAVNVEHGRYVAAHIPGARLVETPGVDHLFWLSAEQTKAVFEEIHRFVEGLSDKSETDRILTTVLFTDVVESTRRASHMGDRAWTELLGRFLDNARTETARFRGKTIKSTGDGMLAIFDGPTRAVRCACVLRDQARAVGLEIRSGLHTGECVLKDGDVNGIAVHIAARVSREAAEGEVLVSGTVRDLSVGSDVHFTDRGIRALKGLEGKWRMFSVDAG